MRILLVTKEAALTQEAQAAFQNTDQLEVFGTWQQALERARGADLMIVDLLATLDEAHRIGGYEKFALSKMADEASKDVPLVLIAPPDDYPLDSMVGWPDFVFGHVRRPVTMKIFRRISTWV